MQAYNQWNSSHEVEYDVEVTQIDKEETKDA
jgi:hypothetical protein